MGTRTTGGQDCSEGCVISWDVPLLPDGKPNDYLWAQREGATEWVAKVTFTPTPDRRLLPTEVALRNTAGHPVTPEMWRRVRIGAAIADARIWLQGAGQLLALIGEDDTERTAAQDLAALAKEETPHGRRYSKEHYREVADVYNSAVATGDTQPVQAVRRAFRRRYPELFGDLSDSTVRGWIRTAKRHGFIKTTARRQRRSAEEPASDGTTTRE